MSEVRYTNDLKGCLALVTAAFVWGSCLVAQKTSGGYVGPATFVGLRSLITGIILLAVITATGGYRKSEKKDRKRIITGSLCCGFFCWTSLYIQQIGVQYTSIGKAGFITSLYIIIIPIMGLIWKRVPGLKIWISVVIAAAGLYLMCMTGGFGGINKGDVLIFIGSVLLSCHFYSIDFFVPEVGAMKLSCYQFIFSGIVSTPVAFATETISIDGIISCALPILYAGVCSGVLGYTLQMVGQKTVEPTKACLLMSLESVFSLLSGMVILGEMLSIREYVGCGLMFVAIILSQLPDNKTEKIPE